MNPMQYNEYEMLRKENMSYLEQKEGTRRFAITSTIAILTLASGDIWEKNVFIYVLPMVVIILCILRTISMERRTREIIGYRIVFLENCDKDIRWVRAVTKYEEYDEERKKFYHRLTSCLQQYDYTILATLCISIYITHFGNSIVDSLINRNTVHVELVVGIAMVVLFVLVFVFSRVRVKIQSKTTFEGIIETWKKVKRNNINC